MTRTPDQWADDASTVNAQADNVAENPDLAPTYQQFADIITDQANHENDEQR
ncbi:hypothetical protein [Actinomadura sp. KC345]|jgi:hypothetical protein|uniref:hypothetical protein n=1 Tax=Actinomadura sp. KC345 TaxID=2530371 RepID=UPI0014049878|nr:hypothetical protein [Actinomadura sp. KC345]